MSGGILLTQQSGILKPIAILLGYLMEGIFFVIDKLGIPNIGLAIILFTIIIYGLMTPLTIKQQKFSKLSAKMNPELQEIQKKYKGKKDNDSMMAMNQETQAVYDKYGVSPTGSCRQLLIQMPILFALYRVIYAIPAYVEQVRRAFFPLVDKLVTDNSAIEFIRGLTTSKMFEKQFTNPQFTEGIANYVASTVDYEANAGNYAANTLIDCLNRMSTTDWNNLISNSQFSNLTTDATNTLNTLTEYNSFLGLNIANSPSATVLQAFGVDKFGEIFSHFSSLNVWLLIGALAIPFLAAFTQWVNVKLMPQPASNNNGNSQQDSMAASMKTMNMMMPLMSAFFCYTLHVGMGIYWIAGAVVRSVQQVIINRHIDKIDMDELIKKNQEKRKKKMEKKGVTAETLNSNAAMSTKKMNTSKSKYTEAEKNEALKKAESSYRNAKPGSITAKANMVRDFNEKNNK